MTPVLWGKDDAWLPVSVSERIASRIPNARRAIIAEAGHFIMEDQPHAVGEQLGAFLAADAV